MEQKQQSYMSFIIVPPSSFNVNEKIYLTNDLIIDSYGYYHQMCIKKNIYTYQFTNGKDILIIIALKYKN